jgi:hypothetical protein
MSHSESLLLNFPELSRRSPLRPPSEDLRKEFGDTDIGLEKARNRGAQSYCRLRFHVSASPTRGKIMELVDEGDTNWTQKLVNNAKERLVISGIGSERLCENSYEFAHVHART